MYDISKTGFSRELSKAARRELGLSQKDVIERTGIPSYKLKQWEGRGLGIELADMRKLSDFYEEQGVNLEELAAHLAKESKGTGSNGGDESDANAMSGFNPRPGFLISTELSSALIDKLQTDMELSDDRISEIIKMGIKSGLLSEFSPQTEAFVQELFAHLAVNYLRFRCLQGRNVIEPTRDEAKTIGNYLAQWVAGQGVQINPADEGKAPAKSKSKRQPEPELAEQE